MLHQAFPSPGRALWTVWLLLLAASFPGAGAAAQKASPPAAQDASPPFVPQVSPPAAQEASPCRGEPVASGTLARVVDGRSFILTDGREVLMSGIEVPRFPDPDDSDAGARARDTLAALLAGPEITLARVGATGDRHGRIVAQVFADGGARWVQAEMLASGHALVSSRIATGACAAALLQREREARAAKLGLWEEPYYEILRAEDHAKVAAERGRFTLVEGKVLSVRESGATTYVNFGRRWSEDFSVTIAKRNIRAFAAAGREPKTLQGRVVRVRGWIEERGGPWIDARNPEQIEVVETDAK